jgi:hypothetical protein
MTTAVEIRHALKSYYAAPEYGLVFEVANSTGHNARRWLDAMSMSLWPSRGLSINGVEIKTSLGDWRREKNEPAKAEELARFCDYFYVTAPKGLIPFPEIPEKWGLLEYADGKIREGKPAVKNEALPITRELLAAVFRAACRDGDPELADAAFREREKKLRAEFDIKVASQAASITQRVNADAAKWLTFCAAIGEDGTRWTDDNGITAAVKVVKDTGIVGTFAGVSILRNSLASALGEIDKAMTGLSIPRKGG